MNSIYLSPHIDDICFSLADLVGRSRGGKLINIYNRSSYVKAHALPGQAVDTEDLVTVVTKIRESEDRVFIKENGLSAKNLDLNDAGIKGDPYELSQIKSDEMELEDVLLSAIFSERSSEAYNILFCPLGIGGHRNHVATYNVIARNNLTLRKKGIGVCFYEDIPYAAYRGARQKWMSESNELLQVGKYTRQVNMLTPERRLRKVRSLLIYRSQFYPDTSPLPAAYSPVLAEAIGMHEALWAAPQEVEALNQLISR